MNSKNVLKVLAGCCALAFAANVLADEFTNTVTTSGGGEWAGVYGAPSWSAQPNTAMNLDVAAEVKLYAKETISGNVVRFYIGNVFDLSALVARAPGSLQSNSNLLVGFQFPSAKNVTLATGTIVGGMKDGSKTMDLSILLDIDRDGVNHLAPAQFNGSNQLLWNLPSGSLPGLVIYDWVIQLHPGPTQAPGNYVLDPECICVPVL
jgi:hypothetical protein